MTHDDPFAFISALHGVTPRARLVATPRPAQETEPMTHQPAPSATPEPTTGRTVHYVLADGQHRAAIITNAFGGRRANLTVHLDLANDVQTSGLATGTGWQVKPHLIPVNSGAFTRGDTLHGASILQDEDTKAPGTWHYPERA